MRDGQELSGARAMLKDWPGLARDYLPPLRELRGGAPEAMKAFSALAQAALRPGALDTKTKELVALGISVAIRCDPCVAFHAEAAAKQGATRAEVLEAIATAIYMGAGPAAMYAAATLEAFDQFSAKQAA
jgi:AhpD family alkylhydroperoxidase